MPVTTFAGARPVGHLAIRMMLRQGTAPARLLTDMYAGGSGSGWWIARECALLLGRSAMPQPQRTDLWSF